MHPANRLAHTLRDALNHNQPLDVLALASGLGIDIDLDFEPSDPHGERYHVGDRMILVDRPLRHRPRLAICVMDTEQWCGLQDAADELEDFLDREA